MTSFISFKIVLNFLLLKNDLGEIIPLKLRSDILNILLLFFFFSMIQTIHFKTIRHIFNEVSTIILCVLTKMPRFKIQFPFL